MKKLRLLTMAALLVTVFSAACAVSHAAVSDSDYIKVGLKYGSNAPANIAVSSPDGLSLYRADGSNISKASSVLDSYTFVNLKNNGSSVAVLDAGGNTITTLKGDGTECVASSQLLSSDSSVTIGGVSYRGGAMPYINSSNKMNVINYVDIEDYLRSVVSVEMSPSYQLEALKAQAVAARSFILSNGNTHKSQGFSVCATTHCQVYGGVRKEDSRTDEAVKETAGKVIYYNGSPVAAYYYASSGGHTENSEDAWTTALGYLRGKADPYSSDSSWTVKITKLQLANALSSKGLGDIKSVSIDRVNDSGYAASVTVTGTKSSYTATKETIRSMFGSAYNMKSRNFTFDTEGGTITSGGGSSTVTIPESGSWYARTINGTTKLGQTVSVVSAAGTSSASLNGLKTVDSSGKVSEISYTPAQTVTVSGSGVATTVTFNSSSDVLIINGKGNGHGVGMSQTGAQGMAKQGFDYLDILQFYYTGIEVR